MRAKKWAVIDKNLKDKKVKKTSGKKGSTTKEIVDNFVATLPKVKSYKTLDKDIKDKYIADYKAISLKRINALKKDIKSYFEAQEKEVLANLKEEMKGLEPNEFRLKGISDILFDGKGAINAGISLITPYIKDFVKKSGIDAVKLAGGTAFDSATTFINNWVTNRAQFFSDSINSTTQDSLKSAIQAGIDNSESLNDISKRVAGVYDIAKGSRTDMIARTEVASASNFGAIEAYKQSDIKQMQWVVVDPQDDDCLENADDIEAIGDSFPSGDDAPPVHPNCQCTTVPVFDDSEDTDENQ